MKAHFHPHTILFLSPMRWITKTLHRSAQGPALLSHFRILCGPRVKMFAHPWTKACQFIAQNPHQKNSNLVNLEFRLAFFPLIKCLQIEKKLYKLLLLSFCFSAHPKIKVFITHGGTHGIYEGICNGVPMLMFPLFGDQGDNVHRLVARGVAEKLSMLDVTTETLLAALKKLIYDKRWPCDSWRTFKSWILKEEEEENNVYKRIVYYSVFNFRCDVIKMPNYS